MPFQWSDSLSLGSPVVDAQHQELIGRVNSVLDAMAAGQGPEQIECLLVFLEEYVVHHFHEEEQVMQEAGYPDCAAHAAEHAAFMSDLARLRDDLAGADGLALPVLQVQRHVCDWIVRHIGDSDRAVSVFLRSAGHADGDPVP